MTQTERPSITQAFTREFAAIGLMQPSNPLLIQPAKLREQYARDGYVYLQSVIDATVVAQVHGSMMAVLERHGFARQSDGRWFPTTKTEGSLAGRSPAWLAAEYEAMELATPLLNHPSLTEVLSLVVDEDIRLLPITEIRSRPPDRESAVYWHQDGFYSARGIDLYAAWLPLTPIDVQLGGLAVAHGMHTVGYLHEDRPPPHYLLAHDAIPDDVQRRANFQPGDVVVFDQALPHTGLSNLSTDGFRCSIDTRFCRASATGAIVGVVVDATPESVRVQTASEEIHTLHVTEDSFLRDRHGDRFPASDVADSEIGAGSRVLAVHDDGTLVSLRPV